MTELLTELLGGFLLALANFAAINDDVVFVRTAINLYGAKREFIEMHRRTPWDRGLSALLRRDSGESGPALLDIFAAAVQTAHLSFLVVDQRKNLFEEFLAILAEELVIGHRGLDGAPDNTKILDLYAHGFNIWGLSNGFSRKLRNHAAAVALNYFAYTFIKIHRTLRMSPAIAAGVRDRLWSVEDLVALWGYYEQRRLERAA